jgi:Outer membrane protein beta-barrel domain
MRMQFSDRWNRQSRSMWLSATGVALFAATLFSGASARAEGFLDVYLGGAFPQDSRVHTAANDPIVDGMIAYQTDVEWETSPSLGIRGGYWMETDPSIIGIALDLSYYRAFEDSKFAALDVVALPITPLLMARIPIGANERFPGGRVQPYAAVGPGFTIAGAHADIDELRDNSSGLNTRLGDFNDASFAVGLDARAGLAVQLAPHFGIYGEYRYTWIEPKFTDKVDTADNFGPFTTAVEIKPKLGTHHLVFGVSFRF